MDNPNMDNSNNETKNEIDELKDLVKKNIELSEELLTISQKINNFIIWQRIFTVLKILIIAIPLILGIIYLPPLLDDLVGTYKDLLGFEDRSGVNELPGNSRK